MNLDLSQLLSHFSTKQGSEHSYYVPCHQFLHSPHRQMLSGVSKLQKGGVMYLPCWC